MSSFPLHIKRGVCKFSMKASGELRSKSSLLDKGVLSPMRQPPDAKRHISGLAVFMPTVRYLLVKSVMAPLAIAAVNILV